MKRKYFHSLDEIASYMFAKYAHNAVERVMNNGQIFYIYTDSGIQHIAFMRVHRGHRYYLEVV